MTSSISSSDSSQRRWRRWLATFLAVLVVAGGGLFAVILALDPYDTGRFALFRSVGVADEDPLTAVVSRGQNPQFDAAIVGSSTGLPLRPALMSQLTGLNFVQLSVYNSKPRQQLVVLRWFLRHHRQIAALVLVADDSWCDADPALPTDSPFPYWLYSDSTAEYLRHIFSTRSLSRIWRQLQIRAGVRSHSDPAGFFDYERGKVWNFHPDLDRRTPEIGSLSADVTAPFPALDRLREQLQTLGPDVAVVVLMPPVFFTELPLPDSAAERRLAVCKTKLAALLAGRPRGGFLDYHTLNAATRNPQNFMDARHYRSNFARRIEHSIATVIATGRVQIDF